VSQSSMNIDLTLEERGSRTDLSSYLVDFKVRLRHDAPSEATAKLSVDTLDMLHHGDTLSFGFDGTSFSGTVVALGLYRGAADSTLLHVTASDALARLQGANHARSWEQPTLYELVDTVAGAHGLRARVPTGLRELAPDWVMQRGDDLDFLVQLGAATGRRVSVEGDILVLDPVSRDLEPLELNLDEDVLAIGLSEDLRRVPGAMTIHGRDPSSSERVVAKLTAGALAAGPGFGPTLANAVLGPRTQSAVSPLAQSSADAEVVADAMLRRAASELIQGWIEIPWQPELVPGRELVLSGLAGDTRLRVFETHHMSDAAGTRTRLVVRSSHSQLTEASRP
jgi:uncharacterized protein